MLTKDITSMLTQHYDPTLDQIILVIRPNTYEVENDLPGNRCNRKTLLKSCFGHIATEAKL
jgi:hypothetical protein